MIPTREEAERLLVEAETMNPGPWIAHSRYVAEAAARIAAVHPALNSERAYIFGLLHDIGRRDGVTKMRHCIAGYRFLHEAGYPDAARICLTHGYVIQQNSSIEDNWDGTPDELAFVKQYLANVTYNDYDHLIQLCDTLALPEGFCLLEQRLVEGALRRGINADTVQQWQARIALLHNFEDALSQSVYALLPGVEEMVFRLRQKG